MNSKPLGRLVFALLIAGGMVIDSASPETRPISIRDWFSKAKSPGNDESPDVKPRRASNNFAAPKADPKPEPVEEAAPIVDATEAEMSQEAAQDTVFEAPIVESDTPIDSPIVESASDRSSDSPVSEPMAMPIEDAIDADPISSPQNAAAMQTANSEVPYILVPSVQGFAEGETIEQFTELTSEPIRGGQIRSGDETINLNDTTIDQLFEEYRRRSEQRQQLNISLDDCLRIALVQNLDIQVAEFDPQRNDGELMQARGEFDPNLVLNSTYRESSTSPSAQTNAFAGFGGGSSGGAGGIGSLLGSLGGGGRSSSGVSSLISSLSGNGNDPTALSTAVSLIAGVASTAIRLGAQLIPFNQQDPIVIESEGWQHSVGLQGKLHWGTEYELRANLNVEESTYSGDMAEWDGGLTLQLTQPLLRGRGKNANLARIRTAKNNRISSEYQLKQTVQQSLSEVVKSYWDLVGAYEQLRVAQRSLSNAVRLLNDNQERYRIGTGNQLEVTQAQASVAERQADLVSRQNQVTQTENRLKQLLDMRDEYVLSPARLVPTDSMPEARVLDIDEELSIQRALENKPDIQTGIIEVENAEIELKRANNELLPELDLVGSYFSGGRGAQKHEVYDGFERRQDETWSIGARATIPITNRQSRGSHTVARISKRQAERRLSKTELDAIVGVENAIASVGSNRIAVESRAQSRAYQEINVEKQETSLRLGATTSFEVLRTQEDLANAEAQEVQSRIDLEKSLVDLELAEGTILENHGIEFMPPDEAEAVPFMRSLVPPAPTVD